MKPRDKYLATKVQDNRFHALGIDNSITTWSLATGLLLPKNPWKYNYSDYEVFSYVYHESSANLAYKEHWAERVLLKGKKPLENVKLE